MKKFTRICLIAGLVLMLCGGAVAGAGYVQGAWPELRGSAVPTTGVIKGQRSLTVTPAEAQSLRFMLSDEDITFTRSADENVHIRYSDATGTAYRSDLEAAPDGSSTFVFVPNPQSKKSSHFFGFSFGTDISEIQVSLPEGFHVSVMTLSGDVDLTDIDCETLDIATSSGDISVDRLTVSDTLTLDAASGDMELQDAAVKGELSMSTVSGEIEISRSSFSGDTRFSTTSGDMDIDAVISGNVSLDTTSGNIQMDLSGSPAHRTGSVSTVSGDMDIQGTDPGAEALIDISTTSGDVTIRS